MSSNHHYPRRLLFVRHGETDWNRQHILQGSRDVPLNEAGRQQAHAFARRIHGWPVDALISSDLVRAWETAEILGRALNVEPHSSPAWREMDLGNWCGLDLEQIKVRFADQVAALARGEDVPRGGGETWAQLQARTVAGLERLNARHTGQTVLIVSHGLTLKAILGHLIGLPFEYLDRLTTGGNMGLSIVQYDEGAPRLNLLNDTSHCRDEQLEPPLL